MEDGKHEQDAISKTFKEGMLEVGDGHSIYWRSHGNPAAPTVVILHGGPGGALNPRWADFFDPDTWQVVLFDQRGCGKSTPFGELRHNGLAELVDDIEKLRIALDIDRWAVFGGSWGTTLGLAYGIRYPERCLGFLLRGIFLARQQDIDWFLWDVRRVFPDAHTRFLDAIEQAAGRRPADLHEVLELTEAPLARFDTNGQRLAQAWTRYEHGLSSVGPMPAEPAASATSEGGASAAGSTTPSPAPQPSASSAAGAPNSPGAQDATDAGTAKPASSNVPASAISMALLERHYMAHELPPAPLLMGIHRIAHLPCYIVHGRFDMVCPADQAQALADAWSGAQLSIVNASGHWTFEPGIAATLRRDAGRLLADIRASGPRD
jgi:proline iminopeptidase